MLRPTWLDCFGLHLKSWPGLVSFDVGARALVGRSAAQCALSTGSLCTTTGHLSGAVVPCVHNVPELVGDLGMGLFSGDKTRASGLLPCVVIFSS